MTTEENEPTPGITYVFYTLAALSLLGGVVLCTTYWPEDGRHSAGGEIAVALSIFWIMAGILEAALFAAIGVALTYLSRISINTNALALITKSQKNHDAATKGMSKDDQTAGRPVRSVEMPPFTG